MKVVKWTVPIAVALVTAASTSLAQQPGPPSGPGPGPGPGMMQGPGGGGGGMGPGRGMGPGGGMGPGTGGGIGPGGGMMGPGGGLGRLAQLDLSESQRGQVFKIQDDLRRKNWELLGKTQDEQAKLRDAYYGSGTRDRAAIVAAYKRIGELRVQRIENSLDAAEKIEALLTPQQREGLKRLGPWWIPGVEQ